MANSEITRRGVCETEEFLEVFRNNNRGVKPVPGRWRPPDEGVLKINTDAAYTPGEEYASWGVIVRNHHGEVVTARAGRTEGVDDAFGA